MYVQKDDPGPDSDEPIRYKFLPPAASAMIARMYASARRPSGPVWPPGAPGAETNMWARAARSLRLSLPTFCFGGDEGRSSKVAPSISISHYGSSACYSNTFMVRCHGVRVDWRGWPRRMDCVVHRSILGHKIACGCKIVTDSI